MKLLIDLLAAVSRHAVGALAGLVTIPLVASALGVDRLGAWVLLAASSFMVGVADLGIGVAIQRQLLAGDRDKAALSLRWAFSIVLVVAPLLAATLLPLTRVSQDIAIARELVSATWLVGAASVIMALRMPCGAWLAVLPEGVRHLALARAAGALTQVLLTAVGIQLLPHLVAPAGGMLAGTLVELVVTVRALRRLEPTLRWTPALPSSEAYSVLATGGAALAINLGAVLSARADALLLGYFAPLATVAAFGVASRAVDNAFAILKQGSAALMPRLGPGVARGQALRWGTALLGGTAAAGMVALMTVGDGVLRGWAGPVAVSPEARITVVLLGSGAILAASHEVTASALMLGGARPWVAAAPLLLGYGVDLIVSPLAAPAFGVWAIAGGTLLGTAVTSAGTWWVARSRLRLDPSALGAPAAAAATALALGLALRSAISVSLWQSAVSCLVVISAGVLSAVLVARRAS